MNILSWKEVEDAVEELAQKIKQSTFNPDYMIGVTTGGLFPLALLAKRLKVKNILTVTAQKTKKGNTEIVTIKYLPEVNLHGKNVLLVDEIAQSGITLHKISEIMREKYGPRILKTATLAANGDVCEFWPDYSVLIEKGDWIKFPWEKERLSPYNLKK